MELAQNALNPSKTTDTPSRQQLAQAVGGGLTPPSTWHMSLGGVGPPIFAVTKNSHCKYLRIS